jgi:hypothetical protein
MTVKVSVPASGLNVPISSLRIGGEVQKEIVVESVDITMQAGRHTSAKLKCKIASRIVASLEAQPISFEIGGSPSYSFRGYIYKIEKSQNLQAQVVCTILAVEMTANAKTPVFGLMRNASGEDIANRVLMGTGLDYYSEGSDVKYPRFALTGRDAWESVVYGAELTGRMVTSLNGALWILAPMDELDRGSAALTLKKSIDTYASGDRTLLDFVPGSRRPKFSNQDLPKAAWFAPDNSIRTENPKVLETSYWLQDVYLPSDDYAKALFARARRKQQMGQTAMVRAKLTPEAMPGMTVDISTGILSSLTDTYDGLWIITEVAHSVVNGSYQTKLTLIRDRYRRTDRNATYSWFYQRASRPRPTARLDEQTSIWVCSWRGR